MNQPGVRDRVAIVGGGPAGLTAALALRDLGYKKIQLFEKAPDVGGKCLTVELLPGVTYELGASSMNGRYENVFRLLDYHELSRRAVDSSRFIDSDHPDRDPTRGPWEDQLPQNVTALISRLLCRPRLIPRDLRLLSPGFGEMTKAELENFSKTLLEELRDGNLMQLETVVRTVVSGIGYGYIDEVPAAYLLKYLALWTPVIEKAQLGPRTYELLQVGFQGLFKRVAADLDRGRSPANRIVRTSHEVTSIVRPKDKQAGVIKVHCATDSGESVFECDHLILACPLDDALRFFLKDDEPSPTEQSFEHLQSYTFHSILTDVTGFPAVRWAFLMHNHFSTKSGLPVLSARRHIDAEKVVFYVLDKDAPAEIKKRPGPRYAHIKGNELTKLASGIASDDQVLSKYVKETLDRLGADLHNRMNLSNLKPLEHVIWKYFPHYSEKDVKAGLPLDLEGEQGKRNTYYVGELLDFSSIECVMRYSRHLVATKFSPVRPKCAAFLPGVLR